MTTTILSWLKKLIVSSFPEDNLIEREKQSSSKDWRSYHYRWLKYGIGAKRFEHTKMVFLIARGETKHVAEYITFIKQQRFDEVQEKETALDNELGRMFDGKEEKKIITSFLQTFTLYLWIYDDGSQELKFVTGAVTSQKLSHTEKIVPVTFQEIQY